jgi:uncharacterized protein (DUF2336 family)
MHSLADLIAEIDGSLEQRSGGERGRTLARITDLFLLRADEYDSDLVAIFDAVMQRLSGSVGVSERAEMAHRLSSSVVAPPGLLRVLAHDEIDVARPVLAQSSLADQDLMAVAIAKGREHLLAICARARVAECVSDVIVSRGDSKASQALVANPGARLSPVSMATLIDQSRLNESLQELLGQRQDLSDAHARDLVEVVKAAAREQLVSSLSGDKPSEVAAKPAPGPGGNPESARAAIQHLAATGFLNEDRLAAFATEGRRDEATATFAKMVELPQGYVDRLFEEVDNELLVVIGRAQGWDWETMRALLKLRNPKLVKPHQFWHAAETFKSMPTSTARQTLDYIKRREASRKAEAPAAQSLVNVK